MSEKEGGNKRRLLRLPAVEPMTFSKNFIRNAVCELRFPSLLELETQAPTAIQKALRKQFPLYETKMLVSVEGNEPVRHQSHLFYSKDKRWIVSLKSFSLALETTKYSSFDDFGEQLSSVLSRVEKFLDTDFYTRVGLRYINALPTGQSKLEAWLNPTLVSSLVTPVLGDTEMCWQEVRGWCDTGRYSIRHGLLPDGEHAPKEYILDFDFYDEAVETKNVETLVPKMHESAYELFMWALADGARAELGPTKRKGDRK